MNEPSQVTTITASIVVIVIALSGLLVYRFVKRNTRGRLWDFACISLLAGLVAQSTALVNPAAEWVLPAVNASGTLILGAVLIGCKYINGRPIRLEIATVIFLAVALAAGTAVAESWGRAVDAAIPTSVVVATLALRSVRECSGPRLGRLREARLLAASLLIATASLPLWVAATYFTGTTSYLGAGLSTVAVLTLVPIAGVSMLSILTVKKLDESENAPDPSERIFVGTKAFQLAVLDMADGIGVMSIAIVRMPVSNEEQLLSVTRALAADLGDYTVVGAFSGSLVVVVSAYSEREMTERITRSLAAQPGHAPAVDVTAYSTDLLAELTGDRTRVAGTRPRM